MTGRRSPTTDEIRLQAAQMITLAGAIDVSVPELGAALAACGLRLQRDQLSVPERVTDVLYAHGSNNGHKRGKK